MRIKRLSEDAIVPTKGSEYSAGYDLYSTQEEVLFAGDTKLIDTGWAIEIPFGYFGAIFARSGLAIKEGLRPANCVGVIDSDYRGAVKVGLYNDSKEIRKIEKGERIAQLVIIPYGVVREGFPDFEEVDELEDTDRGQGGFGSTGKK